MEEVTISVVICTNNRGAGLITCLQRLEEMEVPSNVLWELILVDNNSTDNTESVVAQFAAKSRLDVRYVPEKRPGLSHARNAGIAAARGDIVAFTDDDCMVDKGWLGAIVREFEADPALSGIGGRVELFDIRDKPVTITTCNERRLLSLTDEFVGFIHGCNMAFSRVAFKRIGFFDPRLGAGTRVMSAEDSDFLYRALKAGLKVVYSPDILVYHNHGRRTDLQVEKLMNGYALGRGAFYCKHVIQKDVFILKSAYWELRSLLRAATGRGQPKDMRRRARSFLRYLLSGVRLYLLTTFGRNPQ